MMTNGSTLQGMIDSIVPGNGNMYAAPGNMPGQFQSPYPSPRDMVMQSPYPGYNMYQQPMMMQQPMYPQQQMPMYAAPANPVMMINGVPTELQYQPQETSNPNDRATVTFHNNPGAPTNPDLAHLVGQSAPTTPAPGRYMNNIPTGGTDLYGQARMNMLNRQGVVGGYQPGYNMYNPYNPYAGNQNQGYFQPGSMLDRKIAEYKQKHQHPDIRGYINVYDGKLVHPHVTDGWYGCPNFPFENNAKKSLEMIDQRQKMRDKFNEKFPGYNNPYMTPGFMQQPINNGITREIQDTANVAAFYGMTYDEYINHGVVALKLMSRSCSKYFERSEEETAKREKLYTVKYPKQYGEIPDNDEDLFYPPGAFDFNGQLTREYQVMYTVSQRRVKEYSKLKVVVTKKNGEVVECEQRNIDTLTALNQIDRMAVSDMNYHRWLDNNRVVCATLYNQAPERQIDNVQGTVFQVAAKALAFADQKELEQKYENQRRTRTMNFVNQDDYINSLKAIRDKSKAAAVQYRQRRADEIIHKVSGGQEPILSEPAYTYEGDWIIARPGVDIVGLPLDKSVNKIIAMNTVTEEEEVYNPEAHLTADDIRKRIREMNAKSAPRFDQMIYMDEEALEKRLKSFEEVGFLTQYETGEKV